MSLKTQIYRIGVVSLLALGSLMGCSSADANPTYVKPSTSGMQNTYSGKIGKYDVKLYEKFGCDCDPWKSGCCSNNIIMELAFNGNRWTFADMNDDCIVEYVEKISGDGTVTLVDRNRDFVVDYARSEQWNNADMNVAVSADENYEGRIDYVSNGGEGGSSLVLDRNNDGNADYVERDGRRSLVDRDIGREMERFEDDLLEEPTVIFQTVLRSIRR